MGSWLLVVDSTSVDRAPTCQLLGQEVNNDLQPYVDHPLSGRSRRKPVLVTQLRCLNGEIAKVHPEGVGEEDAARVRICIG